VPSPFSLNHRETFTGITDHDRALTTDRFATLAADILREHGLEASEPKNAAAIMARFGSEFRTPGHIPLCRESEHGLASRQGHTELAVAIARLAGVLPCTIGAEMLQPDGDRALSVADARAYAKKHDIPMITGEQLCTALSIPVMKPKL